MNSPCPTARPAPNPLAGSGLRPGDRPRRTAAASIGAAMLGALAALAAPGIRAAEPAAPPAVQPVVVKAVANFGVDQAALRPADRATLLAEVGKMTGVTWQTVTATGYTDSTGPARHNQRLAQRRAAAVKGYLVAKGIEGSMIATEALAAAKPVASNSSARGRALNRRTEVEFRGVRAATP